MSDIILLQPGGSGYLGKTNGKLTPGKRCFPFFQGVTTAYRWELSTPKRSQARIYRPEAPFPCFDPDVPGNYQISCTDSYGRRYTTDAIVPEGEGGDGAD